MNEIVNKLVSLWASLFYGSSWLAAIGAVMCLLSKTGIGVVIALILALYSVGGFVVSSMIRRHLTGGVKTAAPVKDKPMITVNSGGDRHTKVVIVDGIIYEKSGDSLRAIGKSI